MADTFKVLGQLNPSATTLTDLYTVPALTQTVISSIIVCNTSSSSTTFRVAIAVAGVGDNIKQYLYRDVTCPGNDTFVATIGVTLAATDVVRVYAGNTNLVFQVLGDELTA